MEQAKAGWTRRSLWVLGVCSVMGLLLWWRVFRTVGMMLLWAILLAALQLPLATRLERRMRPGAAAGLSMVLLLTALLLFLGIVFPAIVYQVQQLVGQLPLLLEGLAQWQGFVNGLLEQLGIPPMVDLTSHLGGLDFSFVLRGMVNFAGGIVGWLTQWALVPVIAFYLLKDRRMFCHRLSLWVPVRHRRKALFVAAETRRALMGYLRGQLIVAGLVGGMTALGLLLMQVPAWLALGAWMALCDLIPYFGPLLGALPILIFAGAIGWRKAAWALAVVVLIQQIEGNYLSPRVLGDQTGLHPVTVLISLTVGNMLFGLWGLVLSIPVVVGVRACARTLASS